MKRRTSSIVSALSLLLCIVTMALWIRSKTGGDSIVWKTNNSVISLSSTQAAGCGAFVLSVRPFVPPGQVTSNPAVNEGQRYLFAAIVINVLYEAAPSSRQVGGGVRGRGTVMVMSFDGLIIILTAIPPLWWLLSRNRWRTAYRLKHGLCHRCGYDLTGNVSGRGPECGCLTNDPCGHTDAEGPRTHPLANVQFPDPPSGSTATFVRQDGGIVVSFRRVRRGLKYAWLLGLCLCFAGVLFQLAPKRNEALLFAGAMSIILGVIVTVMAISGRSGRLTVTAGCFGLILERSWRFGSSYQGYPRTEISKVGLSNLGFNPQSLQLEVGRRSIAFQLDQKRPEARWLVKVVRMALELPLDPSEKPQSLPAATSVVVNKHGETTTITARSGWGLLLIFAVILSIILMACLYSLWHSRPTDRSVLEKLIDAVLGLILVCNLLCLALPPSITYNVSCDGRRIGRGLPISVRLPSSSLVARSN